MIHCFGYGRKWVSEVWQLCLLKEKPFSLDKRIQVKKYKPNLNLGVQINIRQEIPQFKIPQARSHVHCVDSAAEQAECSGISPDTSRERPTTQHRRACREHTFSSLENMLI